MALLEQRAAQSSDPTVWNDLAAARFQLGKTEDPELLASSLGAAVHALDIDPNYAPAQFNRALALAALHLIPSAIDAYGRYLVLDGTSAWAEEVRQRIGRLTRQTRSSAWDRAMPQLERECVDDSASGGLKIVADFPEQARRWGEGVYLSNWASDYLINQPAAVRNLLLARCIGNALQQTSGECLLIDAVSAIDLLRGDDQESVARAQIAYLQGRKLYSQHKLQEAAVALAEAERLFRGRSPMALAAMESLANVTADSGNADEAIALTADITKRGADKYKALTADAHAVRALGLGQNGRIYEAFSEIQEAQRDYEALSETDNVARTRASLLAVLTELGRTKDAWRIRGELFAAASVSGHPRIMESALMNAVYDQRVEQQWDIAAAFADEVVRLPVSSPPVRAEALALAAYARAKAGKPYTRATLGQAHAAAGAIPDDRTRARVLDEIGFIEAEITSTTDPHRALGLLNAAIDYRGQSFPYRLPAAYAARARVLRSLGDEAAATGDFDRAVNLLDEQRGSLDRDPSLVDSFIGDDDRIFADAMEQAALLHDYDRLNLFAERVRAHALGPAYRNVRTISITPPRGTTILNFITLDNETVLTIMTERGRRTTSLPIGRQAIAAKRDALVSALISGEPSRVAYAQALYESLFAEASRDWSDSIVIVADDPMAGVPFAALIDPATGRYVVEDHTILVTPALHAWAIRSVPARSDRTHFLGVADPAIDQSRFGKLDRLPAARSEERMVARHYRGSISLADTNATRRAVLTGLPDADIVHFALHAIVGRNTSTSVIPLAAQSGEQDLLYVRDIAVMHLPRRPIVVLAGCQTAVMASGHGSIRSFARAFLTAGASAVAGTLWNVDDTVSRGFSIAFHRHLEETASPAIALRLTQLDLL
ncbi:MAG TPA: CHAT domain-containing protein, partial [Thermoanaerobaculia bacterium]